MTMSVVLDVSVHSGYGSPIHCVLKLYDPGFGSALRDILEGKPAPCTQENEAAFQALVAQGLMPGFLRDLEKRNETQQLPVAAWQFLEDEPDRIEGLAKFDAALWHDCFDHFECVTQGYNRLADLQGKVVPRLLSHVSLTPNTKPTVNRPREEASYFDIRGILLERIDGYCLEDLTGSPLPSNLTSWQRIIQSAADAAHEIHKRGIIIRDCTPRIIDLAQCHLRDELVKRWYKHGWDEDEDWGPDVEYWEQVYTASN